MLRARVLPRPSLARSGAIEEAGNVSAKLSAGPGAQRQAGTRGFTAASGSKRAPGLKDPAIPRSCTVWVHEEGTETGKNPQAEMG